MRETIKPGAKQLRPVATQIRSINDAERTIEFVASTEAVDRYGDVIRTTGWQLDNYKKNPVFLWGHRSGDPPIGKTVAIGIEENPPALVQKVQFAGKDVYPFADTIYRLYKGGFLNATSVGFLPLSTRRLLDENGDETDGTEFMKQELLELSAVPVPANPEALGRMVQKGVISENERKALCGEDNAPWSYMAPGVTYPEDAAADANPSMAQLALDPGEFQDTDNAALAHKLKPERFMGDPQGQECAEDCPAQPPHYKNTIAPEQKEAHLTAAVAAAKYTTRQRMEMFCDEGRRLIEDANAQLKAIRLTVEQSRAMTREGLWQISEELAVLRNRMAELERRTSAWIQIDEKDVRLLVTEILSELRMVCPYHAEPLADPGMTWDADKEMSDASTPAQWKRMSTVIVGDAENKTSYKLPHHRGPSGNFETVKAGVQNALARLDQTDMPAEDRAGAKEHLDRHMAEFEKAAQAEEIRAGDGGAPEKSASETPDPETKSDAPGELPPGVVAILEKMITQPRQ